MPQCFYLDARGGRCPRDTEDGTMFCWEHGPEALQEPPDLRKLSFRLAALVLLIAFLAPLLYGAYLLLRDALN